MYPNTMVERLEPGHVTIYNVWNPAHKEHFDVDTVVMCTARISDEELYRELKAGPGALQAAGVESLYVIGDAAAPRMIADCIFEGHRLAREIDSANPAIPLPFVRERRIWGEVSNKDYESQLRAVRDTAPVS